MFSLHIQTQIDIDSCADAVWQVLTDLSANDGWNPMLKQISGDCRQGQPLSFQVQLSPGKRMAMKARFNRIVPGNELGWQGGSRFAVKGEHYFRLESLPSGGVRLHHGEQFSGLLLPLIYHKLKAAKPLYQALNSALKNRMTTAG